MILKWIRAAADAAVGQREPTTPSEQYRDRARGPLTPVPAPEATRSRMPSGGPYRSAAARPVRSSA